MKIEEICFYNLNYFIFQLENGQDEVFNDIVNYKSLVLMKKYFNKNKQFGIKMREIKDNQLIKTYRDEINNEQQVINYSKRFNKIFKIYDLNEKNYLINLYINDKTSEFLFLNEFEELNYIYINNLFKKFVENYVLNLRLNHADIIQEKSNNFII